MTRAPHAPAGPTQRQLRVGELIRRALSEILARGDLHDPDLGRTPVTVGEVRASPDLKTATAYVLPLGGQGGEALIAALARNKAEIRHQVGRAVELRHIPDLRFRLDETYDRLDDARRLFADDRVRRDLAAEEEGEEGAEDGAGGEDAPGAGDRPA